MNNELTAQQAIKFQILTDAEEYGIEYDEEPPWVRAGLKLTAEDVDLIWEFMEKAAPIGLSDGLYEFRTSGDKIMDNSISYGCDYVARTLDSGVTVGWYYWRDGEPSEVVDWFDEAHLLTCRVEMRPVTIYERIS